MLRRIFQICAVSFVFAGANARAAVPTLYVPHADVVQFQAVVDADGRVVVRWQTTLELGVQGFRLFRRHGGEPRAAVTATPVASHCEESGGCYLAADPSARAGAWVHYELQPVAPSGDGPVEATWDGVPAQEAVVAKPAAQAAQSAAVGQALSLATPWIGPSRVLAWTNSTPADRVRLCVRDEGVYRVTAQELAAAMGVDTATVSAAFASTNLALSCQNVPVAWHAEGTNLYFYGLAATNRFAPENVYWAAFGSGQAMPVASPAWSPAPATNASFIGAFVRQGTNYLSRYYYSSLAGLPASYLAFSPVIQAGGSFQASEPLIDCAPGAWTGTVTVSLLSYFEVVPDAHSAPVSIGGTVVGTPAWSGEQYQSWTFPFASTSLSGSTAALGISNADVPGQPYGILCVSYAFAYPRLYRAENGWLRCTGGSGDTVSVTGFATNDLLALDISNPAQPVVAGSALPSWNAADGSWQTAFPAGDTGCVYAVLSRATGCLLPAVRGVRDVDWASSSNAADDVILIPPEGWRSDIRAVMQPLADFRNAQGLATRIVDVESLYNRYTAGLADPAAIQAFARDGWNWTGSHHLQYLLLAGAGAVDFKQQRLGVNDYTACLIPTLLAGQRFSNGDCMTVAMDPAFGDVNGDNIPEIAVGRLPTTKTQDLAVAVQKTIAYEGALLWKQQCSLAGDWSNTGAKYYLFTQGTDRLVAPLTAAGRTVAKDYPDPADTQGNLAPIRANTLFPQLQAGSGLFHFFGHTDEQNLGGGSGKLLSDGSPITISSANWQKPFIGVVVGCRANRWHAPTTTVCIEPYGLFAPNTGFVAALGATGFLLADEGEELGVTLYSDSATNHTLRLGDVLRRAQQQTIAHPTLNPARLLYPESQDATTRLLCFSLIGDPALVYRHDVTSTGTPVTWLAGYGLTAPNADLADPDGDGWPTYKEYQAGTDPTNRRSVPRVGILYVW